MQRFDSALRLNLHFHTLALDGVYVRDPSSRELRFAALPAPTVAQVLDVAKRTQARVCQLLRESGRYLDDEQAGSDAGDALTAEQPVLASCYQAAASGLELLGRTRADCVVNPVLALAAFATRAAVSNSRALR